jgi:hypothetical protein
MKVLIATLIVLAACGGTEPAPQENGAAAESQPEESIECVTPDPTLVDAIAEGLTTDGEGTLRDAQAVRSDDFDNVWMVAAELDAPGLEADGDIGVWSVGGGVESIADASGIFAVDGIAKEFSDWGADTDDAPSISDHGVDEARECVEANA